MWRETKCHTHGVVQVQKPYVFIEWKLWIESDIEWNESRYTHKPSAMGRMLIADHRSLFRGTRKPFTKKCFWTVKFAPPVQLAGTAPVKHKKMLLQFYYNSDKMNHFCFVNFYIFYMFKLFAFENGITTHSAYNNLIIHNSVMEMRNEKWEWDVLFLFLFWFLFCFVIVNKWKWMYSVFCILHIKYECRTQNAI